MSSRGFKCPLEQDSVPGVQPVSDSDDDLSSPECLLTMQPVEDDYSSDDKARKKDTKGKSLQKHPLISSVDTYNGSTATLNQVKRYFNLCFYSLPSGPTSDDLVHLSIPGILDHLMYFLTNKKDITGKIIVDSVDKWPDREVDVLAKNENFHINFREGRTQLPECHMFSPSNHKNACIFMDKLARSLYLSGLTDAEGSKQHHEAVKACMTQYCRLTSEKVKQNGECILKLESTVRSKRTGQAGSVLFKAQPDLLLTPMVTDYVVPGIPFEVYSPLKKQEVQIRKESQGNKSKEGKKQQKMYAITEDKSFVTDDEGSKSLGKFLAENIPLYMLRKSESCENAFKSKIAAQHLLQIIGAASDYCYRKMHVKCAQMRKCRAFIGFFVCGEYVYITKVQGDENCFAKYNPVYNKQKISEEDLVKHWLSQDVASSEPDQKLHVQFSPIVLDLSIHNHRIALIRFMQYYMYKWDEIDTDRINK